jgi:HSP20 family protein
MARQHSLMRRFADDMDRMFEGFPSSLQRFSPWSWGETRFFPQLEILEREGKLLVRADLPGMNKEDVHVDVSDHSLTIEGERKCEHETTDEGVYACERSYGHFRREVSLPEGVKTDSAKANFKNGILEVTFDASQTSRNRRRVEIGEEITGGTKKESAA